MTAAAIFWEEVRPLLIRRLEVYKNSDCINPIFQAEARQIATLIQFDLDAAKLPINLQFLPPKWMGKVDPHTYKPIK